MLQTFFYSKSTQMENGYSRGTPRALELEYSGTQGTWELEALGCLGTQSPEALGHSKGA